MAEARLAKDEAVNARAHADLAEEEAFLGYGEVGEFGMAQPHYHEG